MMARGKATTSKATAAGKTPRVHPNPPPQANKGSVDVRGTGVYEVGGEDSRALGLLRAEAGQGSMMGGTLIVPPGGLARIPETPYQVGHDQPHPLPVYWTVERPSEWEPQFVVTVWAADPSGPSAQWGHDPNWHGAAPRAYGLDLSRATP
jgi:hypothetical protein